MNRLIRSAGWTMLVAMLLGATLVAMVAAGIWAAGPMDGFVIEFNGKPLTLAPFDTEHWMLAAAGATLALLLVLLIVPVALLLPLLVAAVLTMSALLVLVGAAALVFSPVIVLGGALWLLLRRRRTDPAEPRAEASATIAQ